MAGRKVHIVRLASDAVIPKRGNPGDAGFDLCSVEQIDLPAGDRAAVRTGIALDMPRGLEAQIRSRSGLARDHGVVVLNSPGTIDPDYRGEILVLLVNLGKSDFQVTPGMRIAQMVFSSLTQVDIVSAEKLTSTKRGKGGFGSTGGYG
jgi:dUTP pyrophosphatase